MKDNKGFTLVELIAVVVILGLIASIAIASISGERAKVNEKEKIALRSTIIGSYEIYRTNKLIKEGYDNRVTLNNLKFTNDLSYSKVPCKNLNNSYIYYVTKGSIDGSNSLEEVFCIHLYCDNGYIIDDVNEASNTYCYLGE